MLNSIIDNSVIACVKIIEVTKTVPKKPFQQKPVQQKLFQKKLLYQILLTFLLITIALLIAISIHCYLIKYRSKQKYLLAYHNTSEKLKEININNII